MIKKNIFSIFVALIILYLSLASSETFENVALTNIPFIDKIVHFLMYFGLMSVIIFENRKSITTTRQVLFVAIIPFAYGILMEILQTTLTVTRVADFYDVVFNLTGVLTSLLLWLLIKPRFSKKVRS
jgi:VanZ family protein